MSTSAWLKTCGILVLTAVLAACGSNSTPQVEDDEVFTTSERSWHVETQATTSGVKNGLNYLSDLEPTSIYNDWGPLERDMNNGRGKARDGDVITFDGKKYAKGLGVFAPSEIKYNLEGKCSSFKAVVGLDDFAKYEGSIGRVVFRVYADGKKLFDSGRLRVKSKAVTVNVDVTNAKILRLVVTDGGNTNYDDMADWADAKLECQVVDPPAPVGVDGTFELVPATTPGVNSISFAAETMKLLDDGRVLVVTGRYRSAGATWFFWVFDPASKTFKSAGGSASGAGIAQLQNGTLLVTGGSGAGGVVPSPRTTTYVLSVDDGGLGESVGPMYIARFGHTATTLLDGRVLITGGTTVIDKPNGAPSILPVKQAEIYDPTTKKFTLLNGFDFAYSYAQRLSSGKVFLYGERVDTSTNAILETRFAIFDPVSSRVTQQTVTDKLGS